MFDSIRIIYRVGRHSQVRI